MNKKKILILGTFPNKKSYGQICKGYEVWAVSPCLFDDDISPYIDKVFEIHRKDEYEQDTIGEIIKTQLPVVMAKKDKRVKNVEIYPFDKIYKKYNYYFTNSISLMLVYAVEQGYKDIKISGVEMQSYREAIIERANLEYYIGLFRGQGIKIDTSETTLCTCNMVYGRDNILKRIDQLTNRQKSLVKQKVKYSRIVDRLKLEDIGKMSEKDIKYNNGLFYQIGQIEGAIQMIDEQLRYI